MKSFLTIGLLLVSLAGFSQRNYIYGVVRDSASNQDMIGAHARNINAGLLTSTDPYGKFKIPAKVGDTLVLSSMGHQTLAWVAKEEWFNEEEIEFLLPVNTIYLDEVVVGEFPEYERFKDQIINTEVEDTTFQVYGVPIVKMKEHNQLEKNQYLNPAYVFFHPLSALHHSVSKKEREKRKMQQIRKQSFATERAQLKFTRDWVSESTKLEGDKLTSFIAYCNFSTEYIAATPIYMIHERMMALLPNFLEDYENEGKG
ncbi:MAG: carboxypeptidase-like regulatory domain-containing protein [Bacteroidota bacterium]